MAPLLDIRDLTVVFDTDEGPVRAVDRASFAIAPGQIFGLVGESGCGKSVTAMSLLRLLPTPPARIAGGRVLFNGEDLLRLPIRDLQRLRGRAISMIFQEPMTALSPLHRIGRQLVEALRLHAPQDRRAATGQAREWLGRVGIPDPDGCLQAYPHQLSGGMRQRVMIAMALMHHPALIIADEPTTALDVTVQAQILDLLRAMKDRATSILLITHDMGVIWQLCDRLAVMYASQIVETGAVADIFKSPQHPYTAALLAALPPLDRRAERLPTILGQVPDPRVAIPGCRFAPRCARVMPRCHLEAPPDFATGPASVSRCWLRAPGAAAPHPEPGTGPSETRTP